MPDYRDRQVVVTGGTGALGMAVVSALLEAGATCHLPYRKESELARFAKADKARLKLAPVADLADEAAVAKFYESLPGLWASIHVAGGFAFAPIADSPKTLLMDQLNMNLVSCYLCCRAAVARMVSGKQGGRIVNIAARAAQEWRMGAKMTAYTASKAGVAALSAALAEEVAGEGILVNAVAPSIMDTPANRKDMPKADFSAWVAPADLAKAMLFLASDDARAITGALLPVTGKI